ncbi:MAG: TlpA disulfide reductase family protein [Anaerolineae bacterium]
MRTQIRRQIGQAIGVVLALTAFAAAAVIVMMAGLPDRAALTGDLNPDGSYYAPEVGALAPLFETVTLTGDPFDLESMRGSPVVLNFWATWCAPCAIEMPELQAFHDTHLTLPLFGINTGETPRIIEPWVRDGGYTFPILLDPDNQIARRYALRGQPTTVILAPGGSILTIIFGATTRAALESALAPYLG